MDFVSEVDSQLVLTVGAIAISLLLFLSLSRLALRVLSSGAGTILVVVLIVVLLQAVFGISPKELWFEISHLPQSVSRLVQQMA